jgi:serine protease AprX
MSRSFTIEGVASGVVESPTRTTFLGASPNPMTASTTLRYSLAHEGPASLEIYDVGGRLVRRLVTGEEAAGSHEVVWRATDMTERKVPSGIYMYVFRAGSVRASGRLMLIQ